MSAAEAETQAEELILLHLEMPWDDKANQRSWHI